MQLHQLKPIHKLKKKKRVGRGGKKGSYSGRGIKGQKSRAGRKLVPAIRGILKKYPKLKGYRFKKTEKLLAVVNVGLLEKKFQSLEIITPKSLLSRKLIRKIKGKMPKVKILGKGKLTKKLIIKNCELSKNAEEKIKEAGGQLNNVLKKNN